MKASLASAIFLFGTAAMQPAAASSFHLKLSAGGSWQASNDVQIPNDELGSRFALDDIAGSGPWPAVRLEGIWNVNDRHAVRLLLAPLSYEETGMFDETIRFDGEVFAADQPVTGSYRFNSWRAGYRYHLAERDTWNMWIGGTLKVRDAEIRLVQGGVSASDDDLGLVPLLYLAGNYRLSERWMIAADLDALGGGPGRAIDLGVSLDYRLASRWHAGFEYRLLEGGADVDDIYNFVLFNSALLTLSYR